MDGLLHIALTFDADPDVFDPSLDYRQKSGITWRGVDEGIPRVCDLLSRYTDTEGVAPRVTWFVRIDSQIGDECGHMAVLFQRYAETWALGEARGDAIGWHPHLFRLADGQLQQELRPSELRCALRESWAGMKASGFLPNVSRMGEGFSSNAVMAILEELGVTCDSTAMPGRVRKDVHRSLDWFGTPQEPYHPSRHDYRVPGPDPLELLEVPMSMVPVRAEYDREPLLRYVDLSFHHASIREGLKACVKNSSLLVAVNHPSTVLPYPDGRRHGLLSFEIGEFRRNLEFVLQECGRLKRPVRFVTLREYAALFGQSERDS